MLSIRETKEVSNIFVAKIFLELLAIIFDTFIIDHTVTSQFSYPYSFRGQCSALWQFFGLTLVFGVLADSCV